MGTEERQLSLEVDYELTWAEMLKRVESGEAEPKVLEKAVKLADLVRKAMKEKKMFTVYTNGVWVMK